MHVLQIAGRGHGLCLMKIKKRKTTQAVKTIPALLKEKRIPRAEAMCIPFTKRNKRKKSTPWTERTHDVRCSKHSNEAAGVHMEEDKLDKYLRKPHLPCGDSMFAAATYEVEVGAACTCTPATSADPTWLLLTAHMPKCKATSAAEHAVSTLREGPG
eukprot:1155414-Pelagomonas_calceolata.AAC.3